MERLERALRVFRPSSSDGLNVTERKLDFEITPPDGENPDYRATVTIKTEASFLHSKLIGAKKEPKPESKQKKLDVKDPLAEGFAKEFGTVDMVEIAGTGSDVPVVAPPKIKPRRIENETIFRLVYREGQWELTEQPELTHEQMWFEYAFQQ